MAGHNRRTTEAKYLAASNVLSLSLFFSMVPNKIKEGGKQSQCVETSYAVLPKCDEKQCHMACSQPTPGRSEHISKHLVPLLVLLW